MAYTVGNYIADRFEGMGMKHCFVVPGDFNLVLLDNLLKNENVRQINCCNELNAAYAAEGYARAKGAGALVVTYNVGAFSALNGIAGAYAERLPVVLVSGGYNTNDPVQDHIPHHTIDVLDLHYQFDVMQKVTCDAARILHASEAPHLIDRVVTNVMREKKPGYIEVPSNIAAMECPRPTPLGALTAPPGSDPQALSSAVDAIAGMLERSERPVLLAGPQLRSYGGIKAFGRLASALGCAVAVQPNAKGFFPETSPQFAGVYWGVASSAGCQELVERADLVLSVGPVYSDYATVGWTAQPSPDRRIDVEPFLARTPGAEFTGVALRDLLDALARRVETKDASAMEVRARPPQRAATRPADPDQPLSREEMVRQVQGFLTPNTTLLAESGDSWFDSMYLQLPEGASYEMELQYGSIGWSVGASFGYAIAAEPERRLVSMIGDGSFQLTAQEVANMIRYCRNNVIFLVNNHGYVSESEIHDGPYNYIKNWDYAALMDAWNAGEGKGLGLKARTGRELAEAIEKTRDHWGGPVLIECELRHDDCAPQLKEWGKRVAAANSRPPMKE